MKDIWEITDEDLNTLYSIGAGWEIFNTIKDFGVINVKFRKPYSDKDIKFNEDGYEYKSIFIHPENLSLKEVKQLNIIGYSTAYNQLTK